MTTALPDRTDVGRDSPITVTDLTERGKLFSLEDARAVLTTTEPLTYVPLQPGSGVRFQVEEDWNDGISQKHGTEPIGVHVRLAPSGDLAAPDVSEHQLSKDALLSALKPFGMNGNYALKSPNHLLEDSLNWWYRESLERELQLMAVGPQAVGQAVTRASSRSFSNLALFDRAAALLTERYSADSVYVDVSKLAHSLRRTFLQFVIPAESRTMIGSGASEDAWWAGIQVRNSLTSELQTELSAYYFRPICTNGMVSVGPTMGTWSRQSGGSEPDDVYGWAESVVNDILGGFEHELDQVQSTTGHRLDGEMGDVVRDVFEQYRLPARARSRVIDTLVESDQLTIYSVLNAVTQAANDADRPEEAQALMATGGEIVQHPERCESCHRLLH